MGSYTNIEFTQYIQQDSIKLIFELGSRDLHDAVKLYDFYKCPVYAFECNTDCLHVCKQSISTMTDLQRQNIHLIESAVSVKDGPVTFYPFDLTKYNNMGASSMLEIDFTKRSNTDPDYRRPNPQTQITVPGIRLDTFMADNNIPIVDLLCIDLQGYEYMALLSLGRYLKTVKYIITECSINSTYKNGTNWNRLYAFLKNMGFEYVYSDMFGTCIPESSNEFCEFNTIFKNNHI